MMGGVISDERMAEIKKIKAKDKHDALALEKERKAKEERSSPFVSLRSDFGEQWWSYLILLGARQAGKSYSVMKYILNKYNSGKNVKIYWFRLTDKTQEALLENNADKLVDPDLRRKYDLHLKRKGNMVFDGNKLFVTVLALSTYYNGKGNAFFDKDFDGEYIVVLDEMNREKNERNTFDIVYAFKNQLENVLRHTGSKQAKGTGKVIMIGNTLSEASDLLLPFHFSPEPGQFGKYRLRKQRALIDYMPLTDSYKEMRKGAIVSLIESSDESTFNNEVKQDMSLIDYSRLTKPTGVIAFKDDKKSWFTLWNKNIIAPYNGEHKPIIAMRRYLQGMTYSQVRVDQIQQLFDNGAFKFNAFFTQTLFRYNLMSLHPQVR